MTRLRKLALKRLMVYKVRKQGLLGCKSGKSCDLSSGDLDLHQFMNLV